MKKLITIFLLVGSLLLSGCESKKVEQPNTFYEKMSTMHKEDGWVYYFLLNLNEQEEIYHYQFSGFNLSHKTLPNYYISVLDNNNQEIENFPPSIPSLLNNKELKKEIDDINNFFTSKAFDKSIKENDLKDLELTHFKKKDIVSLFNEVLTLQSPKSFGPFADLPVADFLIEEKGNWQIAYINSYGYIKEVRIDLQEGDKLFTEKCQKKNISVENKNVCNNITAMEQKILEMQSFDIKKHFSSLESKEYNNIFNLLNQIEE